MFKVYLSVVMILPLLVVYTTTASAPPVWDGHQGEQCCVCCEGGIVERGRERQCVVTTTDRCRARGWICQGYQLCPR